LPPLGGEETAVLWLVSSVKLVTDGAVGLSEVVDFTSPAWPSVV